MVSFFMAESEGFGACAPFSDKQWVSTVYPLGNLQVNFLPIRIPLPLLRKTKDKPETNSDLSFAGGE